MRKKRDWQLSEPALRKLRRTLFQVFSLANLNEFDPVIYVELWVSFASLLQSYTALHGLNRSRQAVVEVGEERIVVRHGEDWLDLSRSGTTVNWQREDGRAGKLEFTEHGRLRGDGTDEEEIDMVAERWARDLMRELQR